VNPSAPEPRLSLLDTYWTVVRRALHAADSGVAAAQRQLLERYGKAVNRYLLGALRNADAAEEVGQEFVLRFLQGGLHGADRGKGRFRDFIKGVLFRMVADYHRRRARQGLPLTEETPEPVDQATAPAQAEQQFLDSWRAELLDRSWKALERLEQEHGQPFHTVLRLRAQRPELRSEDLAAELTTRLTRPVSAAWVRQNLHRARDRFADFLLAEVAQTLAEPTANDLEQELIDLGLHDYCKPALARYARNN
jgi:RNA polymerase sigma-70 factor (ECF subfamily)